MDIPFNKDDPFQCTVPENKRLYQGVCSFRIEWRDGKFFDKPYGECHGAAFPDSYQHSSLHKWEPKSITTDLRYSKANADFYEWLLDENTSPFRNSGIFTGMEKIVGTDGYLRAVKITNMEVRAKTMMNFLVMTRHPYEWKASVLMWRKMVSAGVSKHAALVASSVFYNVRESGDTFQYFTYSPEHFAITVDGRAATQPSVQRLVNGTPADTSEPYSKVQSVYGFSGIWGLVGRNDDNRIQVSANVKNKVEIPVYTGSFNRMFTTTGGSTQFNLCNPGTRVAVEYKLDDIIASAPKWSTL